MSGSALAIRSDCSEVIERICAADSPATIAVRSWKAAEKPAMSEYDLMMKALAARGVAATDLRPPLLAANSIHPTYRRTDTHWNRYGALVAYIPPSGEAMTETVLSVIAARRPEMDPRDVIVTGGDAELRAKLEEIYAQGGSKFVVIPAVPPADWTDELQRVHDNVVKPLEN